MVLLRTCFYALLLRLATAQLCEHSKGFFCATPDDCVKRHQSTSSENIIIRLRAACNSTGEICCSKEKYEKPKCGAHNPGGVEGLASKTPRTADFGEYPHMCVILNRTILEEVSRSREMKGGGSLITPRVILTAAHVIQGLEVRSLLVLCGGWDRNRIIESYPTQTREVEKVGLHPEFIAANLHNNFALVFVRNDFEISAHISPVCLPNPDEKPSFADCVGTGFGREDIDTGLVGVQKEVNQSLVAHEECERTLRTTVLGQFFILHQSFRCAGGVDHEDLCKGDGGGPLTCKHSEGLLYQLGISSWGVECKLPVPSVYSDVMYAACWIDTQVSCDASAGSSENLQPVPSLFGFNSCTITCG